MSTESVLSAKQAHSLAVQKLRKPGKEKSIKKKQQKGYPMNPRLKPPGTWGRLIPSNTKHVLQQSLDQMTFNVS